MNAKSHEHIEIVMGTYNGSRFLNEQLQSIIHQTHTNWSLLVTDDGSTDNTLNIINNFKDQVAEHSVKIIAGPKTGFAHNFLHGLARSDSQADYFAFCDQDDIWLEDKLTRGLEALAKLPAGQPVLYCGRTQYFSAEQGVLGMSPLFARKPSFKNALVQSLGGGNTMIMNREARALIVSATFDGAIISHDWWCYLLVEGAGGLTLYDPVPQVLYRQHDENLVGGGNGWAGRFDRLNRAWQGQFRDWTNTNLLGLRHAHEFLTEENFYLVKLMGDARAKGPLASLRFALSQGLHRQTVSGNLSLVGLITLGRL